MLKYFLIAGVMFAILSLLSCQNSNTDDKTAASDSIETPLPAPPPISVRPFDFQFDGEVRGCGNLRAFRFTRDGTKALSVIANKTKLSLSRKTNTFAIGTTENLDVFVEDFGNDTYEYRIGYCYDMLAIRDAEPLRYNAVKGTATVFISEDSFEYRYRVSIILENVEFIDHNNANRFLIPRVEITKVSVGWVPG